MQNDNYSLITIRGYKNKSVAKMDNEEVFIRLKNILIISGFDIALETTGYVSLSDKVRGMDITMMLEDVRDL